ncbi:MAG: glycine cleavage system protein GcvH [Deltaproteobacteria bacterium]|nr:glycine cleavage system protein GcvH [Deltaproteobacteria bacterium]
MADYDFPENLRYSREDEWVCADGNRVTIGISDYAQQQLGDIVFVELPGVGTAVSAGESFGVIESVKAVSDLFAPLSGTVAALNEALADTPEQVNESPYGDGWMLEIEIAGAEELDTLLDAEAYAAYVAERGD